MPKDTAHEGQTQASGSATSPESGDGASADDTGDGRETPAGRTNGETARAAGGRDGEETEAAPADRTADHDGEPLDQVTDEVVDEVVEEIVGERAGPGERAAAEVAVPQPRPRERTPQDRPSEPPADPLTDLEARRREAGVEEDLPFGRPGRPLGRHPFTFGFTGALGVFAAWTLIQAISSSRQVLILIVVSLFLAVGLNPAVEALQRRRLSRRLSVAVVFVGVLLVFVGFGAAIVPPLTNEITAFIDHLPTYIDQLQQNQRVRELDQRYQLLEKLQSTVTNANFGKQAVNGIVGVGRVVIGGLFSTLTVLILTLYFLSSLPAIKNFFYRMAPRSRRARVALLGDEVLARIGGYVAGTVTVALIAGTAAYLYLLIWDVPFALPLALVVALTAFIPLVGATIGAILVCIVAFFTGTGTGIACVIFFVLYQQVENYVIHPRVMKRAVDVHPAVTIIAALIGGTLLGIVGALLAIPTAAAIALIVREVVIPRQETL